MAGNVKVEWRKGQTGGDGTYTFNPKPLVKRNSPGQRVASFEIPNVNGAVIQTLGTGTRKIELEGYIALSNNSFDNLVAAKKALEDGIGTGVGQLHINSPTGVHNYYIGILDGEIGWEMQRSQQILKYSIAILCADPTEYVYVAP